MERGDGKGGREVDCGWNRWRIRPRTVQHLGITALIGPSWRLAAVGCGVPAPSPQNLASWLPLNLPRRPHFRPCLPCRATQQSPIVIHHCRGPAVTKHSRVRTGAAGCGSHVSRDKVTKAQWKVLRQVGSKRILGRRPVRALIRRIAPKLGRRAPQMQLVSKVGQTPKQNSGHPLTSAKTTSPTPSRLVVCLEDLTYTSASRS